jgi:hypothetical protein
MSEEGVDAPADMESEETQPPPLREDMIANALGFISNAQVILTAYLGNLKPERVLPEKASPS